MSSEISFEGFEPKTSENVSESIPPAGPEPGKILTFYSFKGGVGRSMSLANVATLLAAQGNKVLMIDFDLEAPGLEHFFLNHDPSLAERLTRTPGVVDLLAPEPVDWRSARAPVELDFDSMNARRDAKSGHPVAQLDIIHSGRASRDDHAYTDQVQQLNWSDLYEKHDIGTRFGNLRAEWIAAYDFVLIDSRTGVTDIGDLCTVVLPDHLVLLFVTNQQNIEGVASVYHRAVEEHGKMPFERSKLTVLPVLSRDEFYSEAKLSREWRRKAADMLDPLFKDWLPTGLRPIDAFQKIFIPYFAIWSFGEALPVLDEPEAASNPSSINSSYSRIARLIMNDFNWASLDEMADPAEIASTRLDQHRELQEERERAEAELQSQREKFEKEKRSDQRLGFAVLGLGSSLLVASILFAYLYLSTPDLSPEVVRLTEENATLTEDLDQALLSLDKARVDANQRESEIASLQDEASRAAAEIARLTLRLQSADDRLVQASADAAEVTQLRALVQSLQAELSASATSEGADFAALQDRNTQLQKDLAAARAFEERNRELEAILEELRLRNGELDISLFEAASQNSQCRTSLSQALADTDRLRAFMLSQISGYTKRAPLCLDTLNALRSRVENY